MPYTAPYIDASGLHIPTFQDILDDLISSMKSIFGTDIYLENDSLDYQMLAIAARKHYDDCCTAQLVYNNRSPATAIGTALNSIVKLNGLTRLTASYSTCVLTLTGTPATVISNGRCTDTNGNTWALPASVTIGSGGTVTATATCTTIGAITALVGEITTIATPTRGWTSVTNASAAVAGDPIELDSELRTRQAVSVESPSVDLLGGTRSALAALSGVARYVVYENPTGSADTDPNGLDLPAHSITCVVDGGSDADVAEVIFLNRGVGCYTNGDTSLTVYDSLGMGTLINWYRPVYVPIYVTLDVHPIGSYTASLLTDIEDAVTNYLNSLQIGEDVTVSGVMGAALTVMASLIAPTYSIPSLLIGKTLSGQGIYDLLIGYKDVSYGDSTKITVRLA